MPTDLPLAIVTERLHLRLHEPDDLAALANLLTDRDLARGLPGHGLYETLTEVERWLASGLASYATAEPEVSYTITPKDDRAPVLGIAAVAPMPASPGTWRAGVALLPTARGHAYGREAGRAITTHAFSSLGARYVDAIVFMEDKAAVKTAERIGFEDRERADDFSPTARRWRIHYAPGPQPPRRRRRR